MTTDALKTALDLISQPDIAMSSEDLRQVRDELCIAEAENDLQIPFVSTADWGYLRLRRPDYGDPELKAWSERVRQQNWREAFIFFKHEEEGKGPQMAKRFMELAES